MTPLRGNQTPFYFKLALVLISLFALVYLSILGKEVLSPLVFGFLFSVLLLPLSNFLERKLRLHRSASSALSVLVLLAAVTGVLMLVGSQVASLSHDLPQLKEQVLNSLDDFQHWISKTFNINLHKQMAYVNSATQTIESATPKVIGATVVSLSSLLFFLVFTILDTFFLLFYRHRFLHFLVEVFDEKSSLIVYDIIERIQYIIRSYLVGILLEMSTVAIVCCTVFLLLGIKYAILLGLITALFNIVPYIGIFTALVLNIIITFATTGAASTVLLVIITIGSMHVIDINILLPLIVGSKVRINAFVTLLGVVIGEMIWGITGMFLSIPVIAIAKIIFDRVDSLKPWGQVMGDEKVEPKTFKRKRKSSAA